MTDDTRPQCTATHDGHRCVMRRHLVGGHRAWSPSGDPLTIDWPNRPPSPGSGFGGDPCHECSAMTLTSNNRM